MTAANPALQRPQRAAAAQRSRGKKEVVGEEAEGPLFGGGATRGHICAPKTRWCRRPLVTAGASLQRCCYAPPARETHCACFAHPRMRPWGWPRAVLQPGESHGAAGVPKGRHACKALVRKRTQPPSPQRRPIQPRRRPLQPAPAARCMQHAACVRADHKPCAAPMRGPCGPMHAQKEPIARAACSPHRAPPHLTPPNPRSSPTPRQRPSSKTST